MSNLFNYQINLNNCIFSKNKKYIFLLIKKSPGEIDWILPILFYLKKDFNIFTIFKNNQTLELLKKNKVIYNLWVKSSFAFTIQPKYRNISWRLLKKFFFKIKFESFASKLDKIIKKKYFKIDDILNNLKKKINVTSNYNLKISGCFLEYTYKTPWVDNLQKYEKDLKIFYYPHTSNISWSNKYSKITSSKKSLNKFLFLNSKFDINKWSNLLPDANINVSGNPKYDKLWIKKILCKKKRKKNKYVIFLSYNGLEKYHDKKNYISQVKSLMKVCLNIKNSFIRIKIHPFTSKKFLTKILNDYSKDKWEFSDDHLLNLINNCDLFICAFQSASVLEGLALNKAPLELWSVDKKYKRYSRYKKANLSLFIKNKNELQNKFDKIFYDKKKIKKEINLIFNNYNKLINNNKLVKTVKFINKKLN